MYVHTSVMCRLVSLCDKPAYMRELITQLFSASDSRAPPPHNTSISGPSPRKKNQKTSMMRLITLRRYVVHLCLTWDLLRALDAPTGGKNTRERKNSERIMTIPHASDVLLRMYVVEEGVILLTHSSPLNEECLDV